MTADHTYQSGSGTDSWPTPTSKANSWPRPPMSPPCVGPEDLEPMLEAILDHPVGTLGPTLAPRVTLIDTK